MATLTLKIKTLTPLWTGGVVVGEMLNLLDRLGFGWGKPDDNNPESVLGHITEKVTVNLERLLLAKETLEQTLIYARYGAKAAGN